MKVGVIGCGNISHIYLKNAALFPDVDMVAVADLNPDAARARADEFGLRAMEVGALLEAPDVDTVLNLTIPAAHAEIALAAIAQGKHVYTEKPLAVTRDEARAILDAGQAAGKLVASAPDTVLGAGVQKGRQLIESGAIGRVITGLSVLMSRGMEWWHPSPDFFFKPGGGPVLDMGPYYVAMLVQLLGPVSKVTAAGTIGLPERTITAPNSPRLGETITVETLTTVQGVLEFACGAQVAFSYSWDVHQHGGRHLELYGELGSLRLPDPNYFGGVIEMSLGKEPWQTIDTGVHDLGRVNYPPDAPVGANFRGIGLQDLAEAIRDGRSPRASGEMGYHVLDVLTAIGEAAAQGRAVDVTSDPQRPEPMPLDGLAGTTLVAQGG